MLHRRDLLKLAVGGASAPLLLASTGHADAPATPPPPVAPAPPAPPPVFGGFHTALPFDFKASTPVDLARELAKQPFKPISDELPSPFAKLSFEQYNAIQLKAPLRIWGDGSAAFVVEPLHRGSQFPFPIQIDIVENGKAYRLIYETRLFDFGKLTPSPKTPDIGFSGFRILRSKEGGTANEVATFQGTNFFRALADGQVPGLMARALALKVADPKGEETPYFRQIWIEKPSAVDALITVHALVDSESLTGAFRFTIRPGGATIIDTEATLFARTTINNYGLASMSATHLLGFMDHKRFDDYRPNVYETGGLQMLTGAGEWVWRPVTNRETLQISNFVDNKPHGFGSIMRDRDFEYFLDEEQHWERRPSLWIEPLGEWGEGSVQLIEIPSQSDNNDNILCFWRPRAPLQAGSETSFAYRQFWCWDPPQQPDLARTRSSHVGVVGGRTRFFIEFGGDILADKKRTEGLSPTLTASNGSLTTIKTTLDLERKAYRVLFDLDPQNADGSELRLVLEAQGKRISETWLYRWTPA